MRKFFGFSFVNSNVNPKLAPLFSAKIRLIRSTKEEAMPIFDTFLKQNPLARGFQVTESQNDRFQFVLLTGIDAKRYQVDWDDIENRYRGKTTFEDLQQRRREVERLNREHTPQPEAFDADI